MVVFIVIVSFRRLILPCWDVMCYMQATVEQRAEMSVRENRRSGYRTLHVLPKSDGFRNGGRCDLCQVPHEQGAADTIMHM